MWDGRSLWAWSVCCAAVSMLLWSFGSVENAEGIMVGNGNMGV
jgi:hypothetical protein